MLTLLPILFLQLALLIGYPKGPPVRGAWRLSLVLEMWVVLVLAVEGGAAGDGGRRHRAWRSMGLVWHMELLRSVMETMQLTFGRSMWLVERGSLDLSLGLRRKRRVRVGTLLVVLVLLLLLMVERLGWCLWLGRMMIRCISWIEVGGVRDITALRMKGHHGLREKEAIKSGTLRMRGTKV